MRNTGVHSFNVVRFTKPPVDSVPLHFTSGDKRVLNHFCPWTCARAQVCRKKENSFENTQRESDKDYNIVLLCVYVPRIIIFHVNRDNIILRCGINNKLDYVLEQNQSRTYLWDGHRTPISASSVQL